MDTSNVQSLQIAVRRQLWRGAFFAAARLALWGSAGLMLLAVAVHLGARPIGIQSVFPAIVALWIAMMAWAGVRRPADAVCALWADRHLGGASAFSTLLEMRKGEQAIANDRAVRCLERWAVARVPHALRLLGARSESAGLARPLLSVLVCTALATVVLTLPDTAPSKREGFPAPPPASVAERAGPDAAPRAAPELVSALVTALRSAESQRASESRGDSRAPAAGPGRRDAGTGSRMAQPGVAPPGERTPAGGPLADASGDAAPKARANQSSSAGSGHDAGDGSDDRADAGVSRVPRGTMQVQRRVPSERPAAPERQADMDQLATFDEDLPSYRTAKAREGPAPAAASRPPAIDATPLNPITAAYVQAWMKASRQYR